MSSVGTITTSTAILSTTIMVPTIEDNDMKNLNGTVTKKPFKKGIYQPIRFFLIENFVSFSKEIIIGIIAGVIVLILAILAGIGIFIFIKR
jgi:hypothetical protein